MLELVPRFLSIVHPRADEDYVDRLVSYYSIILLVLSTILVSAKQYVGSPLQCWVPAHFTGAMEQYTENYCWVQSTWFLPVRQRMPWHVVDREERKIEYYQWIPFILLLQALLCLLPTRFWRFSNGCSGHDPKSLLSSARACRSATDVTTHEHAINSIADHLHKPRDVRHETFAGTVVRYVRNYGILLCYLLTKAMYFTVVLLQFFVMTNLLQIANPFFGFRMWQDLRNGRDWEESGVFPRVTMCDFEVKVMGNLHRYTVQCVLLINMFNEKIFMVVWFWFAAMLVAVVCSFLYWATFLFSCFQRGFVLRHLMATRQMSPTSQRVQLTRFVDYFLGADVVFLLALMKSHAGSIVVSEVLLALWRKHRAQVPEPLLALDTQLSCADGEKAQVLLTQQSQYKSSLDDLKRSPAGSFVETLNEYMDDQDQDHPEMMDEQNLNVMVTEGPPPTYSNTATPERDAKDPELVPLLGVTAPSDTTPSGDGSNTAAAAAMLAVPLLMRRQQKRAREQAMMLGGDWARDISDRTRAHANYRGSGGYTGRRRHHSAGGRLLKTAAAASLIGAAARRKR